MNPHKNINFNRNVPPYTYMHTYSVCAPKNKTKHKTLSMATYINRQWSVKSINTVAYSQFVA